MSTFAYANPSSGPSAGGIGWFDFGNITITPGSPLTGLTATLDNGCKVTFDIEATHISGYNRVFNAVQPPTWPLTFFGKGYYTGILGNVALYTSVIPLTAPLAVNTMQLDITNIVVLDPNGNPVPNYTVVIADAETTNSDENWVLNTDGGDWVKFATLGSNPPPLTGIGSQTASITGLILVGIEADYVLTTQNAKNLTLSTTENQRTGQQAVAIGFAITQVSLYKDIGERINSNDQFVLSIGGTPDDQETTTGSATGVQSVFANVYGIPGNTVYTTVFRNNYRQQINDLIESIALQEAALAAIQQAEGAKIQKFAALKGVSPETLACVNKSVSDLNDAITTLESILKQKLNAVNCQINGKC